MYYYELSNIISSKNILLAGRERIKCVFYKFNRVCDLKKMDVRTKRRIMFIIIIMSIIITITGFLIFQINFGKYTRIIKVDEDAYVYEFKPDTNYGKDENITVGNYHDGKTEAYYHFDLSSLPDGWTKADAQVEFNYGSDIVNVGCNLTYESWDETTITWDNKPNNSVYYAYILCDGFGFRIPLNPEHVINGEVTLCLFGRGGEDDGFIQGNSREGAPHENVPPNIWIHYEGLDPFFLTGAIVAYFVIGVIITLYLVLRNRLALSPINQRFETLPQKRILKPTLTYKINDLVDLRLINDRTYIYVNNKRLMVCTFLLINIPVEKIHEYDEIKSIDEAAEILDNGMHIIPSRHYEISPEEEFKAHCSNIQAFFENGLNTNILHTNVAFPLLKELVEQGFESAQKVFKEEIAIRFNEGTFNSRRFLHLQGYLKYLNKNEQQALEGYSEFIDSLSRQPSRRFGKQELQRLPARPYISLNGEILFKVVILGNNDVGRTLIIEDLSKSFSIGHKSGFISLVIKRVEIDNRIVKLLIHVPSNSQMIITSTIVKSFGSLIMYGFPLSLGVIIMYDITNANSVSRIPEWIQLIRENRGNIPILLVGNKADLKENRVVPKEAGEKIKTDYRLSSFMEVSAKTGENLEILFEKISHLLLKKNFPYKY